MCQLLGMNCAKPTDFNFSFTGFAKRGGATDKHEDGWGLAFYEGRGIRAFHDPLPAAKSPIADLVAQYPCKTLNMISHIRYATEGERLLENVHPFQRELWGIQWVFAHNGDVPAFSSSRNTKDCVDIDSPRSHRNLLRTPLPSDNSSSSSTCNTMTYFPVGTTDSEAIFCAIMNALKSKFSEPPPVSILYTFLEHICAEIVQSHGEGECVILNFILCAGEKMLFAYSWPGSRPGSKVWNGLYYIVRQYPFRIATLKDCDVCVDFSAVTEPDDCVSVIATAPLTKDEQWVEFQQGQMIVFEHGRPFSSAKSLEALDQMGRGLSPSDSYLQQKEKFC